MKRMLVMLLTLLLLTGCSRTEPVPAEPQTPPVAEEQTPVTPIPAPEPEPIGEPEPVPEPIPDPDPVPEVKPTPAPVPAPEPEPTPAPVPEPEPTWATVAVEAFVAITDHPEFNVLVWQENDARTDLVIQRGVNDWNVAYVTEALSSFAWTEATYEDVLAATQGKGEGPELLFWDVDGGMGFSCFQNTDYVTLRDQTKMIWLQAVDPNGNGMLYDLLSIVAEDAVSHQVLNVTVDGSVSPNEAAGRMAEKIAENYRSVPDWVSWKPETVRAERAEVYDIYRGTPEEFCFDLDLAVKVADPMAPEAVYWQAGAGLQSPDEDGYYGWGHQTWVRKNNEGNWSIVEWGTGGYAVMPQNLENKPQLEWLVELFCLTEGFTHDWAAPNQILNLDPEELAALPDVLDQLTEAEGKALCRTLGMLLRENDCWILTVDDLKPLLGDYGAWLDV